MTIEIQEPRLEAMIQQRMASGQFESVEDLLLQSLGINGAAEPKWVPKQNLDEFLRQSPLWASGLTVERQKDTPRTVEL